PHRALPRPAEARFRTLEAARAFEEGVNAYEQKEYSAALAAFRRAVQNDPQRLIGQAWLSRTLLVMGDRRGAEAAGRVAVQLLTPETPRADALFAQAAFAEAQNDLDVAEKRQRELAGLVNDDPTGHAELADFLRRQDRNQPSIEAYH